jgi:predicted dehydrogenase
VSCVCLSNIFFNGQWCFTVAEENAQEDLCEITGSEGKISFPVFGHEAKYCRPALRRRIDLILRHQQHIQQPMIEKVVQYFLGKGENPCSAADAIESMKVMERFAYGK